MLNNTKAKESKTLYWVIGGIGALLVVGLFVTVLAGAITFFVMSSSAAEKKVENASMRNEIEKALPDINKVGKFTNDDGKGTYTEFKFFDTANTELYYSYSAPSGKFMDMVGVRIAIFKNKGEAAKFIKERLKEIEANEGQIIKKEKKENGFYFEYYSPGSKVSKKIKKIVSCKDRICYRIDAFKQENVEPFSTAFKKKAKF